MAVYTEILRELREDSDLTQAQVAAVLGTTQQVYARYEKGINELPVRHLRALCLLYEVSADYILGLPEGAETASVKISAPLTKIFQNFYKNETKTP
ncbi:MAG: helix-turn-helix domain-containing protein [Oscillospiraceae bacterium]